MAVGEQFKHANLGNLLRLTLLAPNVVETMLNGRQMGSAVLPQLLEPFASEWSAQREAFEFNKAPVHLGHG